MAEKPKIAVCGVWQKQPSASLSLWIAQNSHNMNSYQDPVLCSLISKIADKRSFLKLIFEWHLQTTTGEAFSEVLGKHRHMLWL